MKRLALCPGCGTRFPRWFFFKVMPHVHYRCRACGCRYQSEPLWEWAGDIIGGALLGGILLLGFFHLISWPAAILLAVALGAAGFFLFPYVTRFVLVSPAEERPDGSSRAR